MPLCEICGTSYTPTPEALDCPRCRDRVSRLAGESAPEKPAPKAVRSTGAKAAAPGPRPARPADSAAPAPARPAAARPGPAPTRPTPARPAPTRAAPARAAARPAPEEPEDEPRIHRGGDQAGAPPLDQATRIGLIASLGFAVVVGVVVLMVWRTKSAEKRDLDAYEQNVQDLYKQLSSLDLKDAASAERIVKLATDKQATWEDHQLAAQIESLVARAKAGLTSAQEEKKSMARFTEIEKQLEKGGIPVEQLKDLRRQLDESEAGLAGGGPELVARLALARKKADESYATGLLDSAKATAEATPGSTRPGLTRYQTVEDELKGLLDRAIFAKNNEQRDFYSPLYKRAIEESDVLAATLFKEEGEKLPWTDCLVPPQGGYWNPSKAKGFSAAVKNNALMIIGPDSDSGQQAVVSIGDREQWRHFQLDLEFTVEKGNLDLVFRLGKGVNPSTFSYPLHTTGTDAGLKAGKKYAARMSLIGSRLTVRYANEDIDTPSAAEIPVNWTMVRKGAVGFVVSPESRASFTRFQVRELR